MIDRSHALPLARQAELLKLSRSSLYYVPCPVSPASGTLPMSSPVCYVAG